ncbi:hypothetical protein K9M48_01215 [Candidatus Gracilibacteria bacterium]|nr:hypothetical protein [Candidatus Gracilibacteria bacterium]
MKTKNLFSKIKNLYILIIGLILGISILVGVNAAYSSILVGETAPDSGGEITVSWGTKVHNFVNSRLVDGTNLMTAKILNVAGLNVNGPMEVSDSFKYNPGGQYAPEQYKVLVAQDNQGFAGWQDITSWFTSSTATGARGATGTAGIGITAATINTTGNLILTLSNNSTLDAGLVKGTDGTDGISVSGAIVDANGDLVFTLSNGNEINLGSLSTTATPWDHVASQNINLNDKRISNDGTPDHGIQIDIDNNINFGLSQLFTDGMIRAKNGISTTNIATSGQIIAYGVNSDIRSQGNLITSQTLKMYSGVTLVDYGQYFINEDGTNGQVWKSDGNGRGYRGVDNDTQPTPPDNLGDHTATTNINLRDNRLTNIPAGQVFDPLVPRGLGIDTDGRVGIGIVSPDPSVKLHVGGSIGFSGTLKAIGGNYIHFTNDAATGGPYNGNVGIGQLNPQATLHVNGGTKVNKMMEASCGTPDQNRGIKIGDGNSYIYDSSCPSGSQRWAQVATGSISPNLSTLNNPIQDLNPFPTVISNPVPPVAQYQILGAPDPEPEPLVVNTLHIESDEGIIVSAKDASTNTIDKAMLHLMNNGTGYILATRFGIGTNSPQNQFHVRGTSRFDGAIKLVPDYGQTNIYAADTAIGQGTDVTIRGGGTTAVGQVNGGDLELLGGTRQSGSSSANGGAIVIKGGYNDTYGPSYNPPIGGSIFIYPGSTLSGNTRGNVIIGHNGTTSGTPLGKVGIGTKSPKQMLDVNGAIKVGTTGPTCNADYAGTIRYESSNFQGCKCLAGICNRVNL